MNEEGWKFLLEGTGKTLADLNPKPEPISDEMRALLEELGVPEKEKGNLPEEPKM